MVRARNRLKEVREFIMNAPCPYCKDGEGEIVEREIAELGGLVIRFACEVCSEEWRVTF